MDMLEAVHLNEDGVGRFPVSATTWANGVIRYDLMNDRPFRNGDTVQFSHAIILCHCGGVQGTCGCEETT